MYDISSNLYFEAATIAPSQKLVKSPGAPITGNTVNGFLFTGEPIQTTESCDAVSETSNLSSSPKTALASGPSGGGTVSMSNVPCAVDKSNENVTGADDSTQKATSTVGCVSNTIPTGTIQTASLVTEDVVLSGAENRTQSTSLVSSQAGCFPTTVSTGITAQVTENVILKGTERHTQSSSLVTSQVGSVPSTESTNIAQTAAQATAPPMVSEKEKETIDSLQLQSVNAESPADEKCTQDDPKRRELQVRHHSSIEVADVTKIRLSEDRLLEKRRMDDDFQSDDDTEKDISPFLVQYKPPSIEVIDVAKIPLPLGMGHHMAQ